MPTKLDAAALGQLFFDARTHNTWLPQEVPDSLLRELVDTLKMGPTSANCSPARIVFVKSPEAKARLKPLLDEGNVAKTMAAPVTAIIGHDFAFYEHLPKLFPHANARAWFAGKPDHIAATAFRNGSLQGAYLILAARALGLDCGPMSASTMRAWTRNSSPARRSNPTSCAISAMAIRRHCSRVRRDSPSTRWRRSNEHPRIRYLLRSLHRGCRQRCRRECAEHHLFRRTHGIGPRRAAGADDR